MAQVTIGEEQTTPIQNETFEVKPNDVVIDNTPTNDEDKIMPPSDRITGLISEEINDPNKISVTIADKDAPIVILFGPPACGKTMTLVRLTRFLRTTSSLFAHSVQIMIRTMQKYVMISTS